MKKNANILLRMHQKEARAGITRVGVDGALGKFCKVFYIIAFIYTMGINLIYLLSIWMNSNHVVESVGKENLSVLQEDQLAGVKNSMILVSLLSALLISGLVLLALRVHLPSLIINTATPIVLLLHFAQRMSETLAANGLLCSYTYNHLIPLGILLITGFVFSLKGLLFTISENRAYTDFVDKLYERNSADFDKMTDEEWEEFLSSYEPPRPQKLKRSLKSRAKKEELN